jgi:hypothetical protein
MNTQAFLNLPGPVKALLAAMTGVSLLGVIFIAASGNTAMLYLLGVIFVVVALLGGLYAAILRLGKKKKARKMDQMLQQHNTASPSAVSGADARVKLDDLRQRFSSGIQQYKKHGKDLYSLPWFLIVGEPGSGKTEAVRRSGIGFPPNLQDEQQGLGGTINMNWWFTNHGVVLDTAGRLLFEEIAPGSTSEWKEFLTLLRRSRSDCPINGLILAIPTDSLIKDTSADIEAKAKRIAVQLDEIQRILDIRFPVFVLITKADLIPGFREFFKDLQNPELEHQMVGWSNPAPLDAAFNPQQVDEYLAGLIGSIEKRRYPLLREPDHSGVDHGERWIDQVDSVYTFPRALEQILPRLRRFLELIFVAGEWAQKPLFLRGIYVTSSLQEGAVLDRDLAVALGMDVQDLPEEITFVRKGALFLRDVYLEKIFREKSLVTRATNAGGVVKRRQMMVFGIGFAALAASLALAWVGGSSLKTSIGEQQSYWSAAASDRLWSGDRWRLPIVEDSPVRDGFISNEQKLITVDDEQVPLIDFIAQLVDFSKEEIKTPFIFKPVEWVSSGLTSRETERSKAVKVVFEAGVLRPLIEGAHDEFQLPDTVWSPQARDALTSLIRLERQVAEQRMGLNPGFAESGRMIPVLMQYLADEPGDPRLVEAADWIYGQSPGSAASWPPDWVSAGNSLDSNRPLRAAVEKFIGYVKEQSVSQQDNLALIESMSARLAQIDEAEQALFAAVARIDAAAPAEGISTAQGILTSRIQPAAQALRELQATALQRGVVAADEPFLLGVAYERELASARETIQSTIAEIQSELPAEGPLADSGGTGGTLFSDIRERLETAQAEIAQVVASALPPDQVQKLAFYDSDFLSLDPLGEAHFFTRLGRYTALLDAFNAGRAEHSPVGRLAERVQAYEQASAAGLIEREAYRGPREQSVDTASRKLSELFRAQYFQRLAADYRSGLTSLVEGLRFPLVLPVTNDSLSPEQVEEVGALLDAVDKELQGPALELFAPADQRSLGDFRARLRPVIALGRSLAAGQAGTARVEVSLPGQQLQNDVLQQLVDGADIAHINFKWEEVRLNNDASVRTRRPTGELLGKVSLAAPELNLRFYRLSQEDPDPLRFSGNWAPLQWLLSSKVSPGPGGQDFNVLVQRTDDGITYSMVVSLDFPGPLPAAEDWPKAADLLRRN